MFKVIESDITKSGKALSIFNRDMALFVKNWNNTQGLKNRLQSAFTNPNVITQHDLTQINEYNKAISSGVSKQTAFYRCLGDSSIAVQNLAANARYGTINTEGLVVVTEELTLAQRAATVASKALSISLNLISNIAFAMAINAIITKVTEFVNKEKELCDSAKESANEIKSQADEMKKLVSEYESIIDSEKSEAEKTEELNEWKQNLVETYGFEKDKLEELNTERERGIELLKEEIDAVNQRERGIWLAENSTQFTTAKEKIINPSSSSNSRLLDGSVNSDIFTKINQNNIRDSIKNKFNSISTIGNSTFFDFKGENLIETYDNLQNLLSALGNAKNLSDDEKRLLNELKKEEKAIKKVLDDYQVIYETGYKYLAQNNFEDFAKENPLDNVGKENYLSWRSGLLETAQGDKQLSSELEELIANQFPDLTKYFNNLDKAYDMFGIDNVINDANEGMKKAFINGLSDEDLEIATQIPDLFADGLKGATKKIEEWKKQNSIETEVKITIDEALEGQTNKIKAITSAMEDMADTGYITSETYAELAKLGGNFTDCLEQENGKLKLNVDKLKDLEIQQLATAKSANSLAISELELKAASLAAHGQDFSDIQAQIEALMKENAVYTQLMEEIANAKPDDKSSSGKSEEPESVTQFKKALAEKEHLLNTNQISEQDYYEWLDSESKRVYGNLADYEEDLWKYEEQVYKWRQEQEQDLFDKKIENYKKLSDNALNDKITDFGVSNEDVKNLEEFNKEMQKTWGLGNVDLTKRPKVAMDDGSTATVLSSTEFIWQGDDENGQYVAIHYTPILPDGTVLDDKTLEDYLYNTLEGSEDILKADNLGIVLKVDSDLSASEQEIKDLLNGISDNVQKILDDIEKWDNGLHEVQERWVELDNKVKSSDSTTTYANKWDYARSQINSAITETQNRINGLSLKKGFEDEIEELTSDLEGLYDTLEDINKQEIESQKEYIQTLKDEYSDLMDEQIDQQKKLSEEIEKSYENRISAIDKQIDALKKVSEAEERQKSILEAEKDVKEAMLELDKAKTKKRLVYSGDGTWQLKENKSAVKEAQDNLAEKQEALDEAKQDEQIAKLEEQKELLETQKDNSKEYYDKVVEDLESQKEAREKQYGILVDIYEQLGGDKKQTSLNDSLVEKLTANGDINKAVQGLTPTEMKQAITSGVLTTDSNGDYTIDYSILDKNEQAVKDNTAELEKLNNQLSGKSDAVNSNTPTYNNKNLDAEGYLIDTDGKRVLHDGKPIHAKNFSDEIAKRNTSKKMTDVVKGIGKFAGYDTMQDLINAMITGEYTIPKSQLSNFMGATISPKISQNIPRMGEYMTNAVNNTAPPINFTVNVDGSADEKTVQAMKNEIGNALISYTDKLISAIPVSSMRRQNKS